jgi:hypothetical protein
MTLSGGVGNPGGGFSMRLSGSVGNPGGGGGGLFDEALRGWPSRPREAAGERIFAGWGRGGWVGLGGELLLVLGFACGDFCFLQSIDAGALWGMAGAEPGVLGRVGDN